jgi:lysozyme
VSAAGYAFAYLKATEGVDGLDPTFADHWRTVGETSMRRGAYHFYVTEDDPEAQAAFFIETVGELGPDDLVPVVDVELIGHGTQPGLEERLRTFLERIEERYGVKAMIYTSPNFWNAHLDETFADHPLWVAEYGTEEPRLPSGWQTWHLWQWAENRRVPGIEKDVDPNRLAPTVPLESLHIGSQSGGAQP